MIDKEVLNPKKKKTYKKMMKHFRKLLSDDVKNACPSDWGFGLDLFIDFLKWMQAYYELGYNVWAYEKKDENPELYRDVPTRADSLSETIFYYNKWQNVASDYYKIARNEKEVKHYLELGFYQDEDRKGTFRLYKDRKQNVNECHKAEEDYKHKFFECLEKYIEYWWD